MTCMRFFSKRFAYIGLHVKSMRFLEMTERVRFSFKFANLREKRFWPEGTRREGECEKDQKEGRAPANLVRSKITNK